VEVEEGCDNLVSKVCGVTFVNCSDMYRGGKYANGPMNSQGYVSGNRAIMLKNRPGSERVGYALNVAKMPRRRKAAYRGSYLCDNMVK
jgi:hypothetical protein